MLQFVKIEQEKLSEINEQQLRSKIVLGDKEALRTFFNIYFGRLYKFVFRRVNGDVHIAEDITQETCLKALENLAKFHGDSSLYTWMCTIAINLIRLKAKTAKRKEFTEFPWIAVENNPEGQTDKDRLKSIVRQAITCLPVHYQQILEAKYTLGLSQNEISVQMGMSEKAVESLLTRARNALREEVKKHFRSE